MDGSKARSGDHGDARIPLWFMGFMFAIAQAAILVVVLH